MISTYRWWSNWADFPTSLGRNILPYLHPAQPRQMYCWIPFVFLCLCSYEVAPGKWFYSLVTSTEGCSNCPVIAQAKWQRVLSHLYDPGLCCESDYWANPPQDFLSPQQAGDGDVFSLVCPWLCSRVVWNDFSSLGWYEISWCSLLWACSLAHYREQTWKLHLNTQNILMERGHMHGRI